VALIERKPDPAAFNRICGHYLQPGAAPVLRELGEPLGRGLQGYRRRHRHELAQHAFLVNDFARREKLPPVQRLLLAAAIHDERVAERLHMIGGRTARPTRALTPRVLARAALVAARHRRRAAARPLEVAATPAGSAGS